MTPRSNSRIRWIFAVLVVVLMAVFALGCGPTYTPVQEGKCGPGRSWVPPKQDDNGEWKAGYCASGGQQ